MQLLMAIKEALRDQVSSSRIGCMFHDLMQEAGYSVEEIRAAASSMANKDKNDADEILHSEQERQMILKELGIHTEKKP